MKNNLQKKIIKLHDGLENDFLSKGRGISCPLCNGIINVTLYNAKLLHSFDSIEINKFMKGLGNIKTNSKHDELYYKKGVVMCKREICSNKEHDFHIIFNYEETQPSRYLSYLLGVFLID